MSYSQAVRVREHVDSRPVWILVGLLGVTAAALALNLGAIGWFPISFFAVPLILGSFFLSRRLLLVLTLAVTLSLVVEIASVGVTAPRVAVAAVILTVGVMLLLAPGRSTLGRGLIGESMLIDLRDRLRQQGVLPELPRQWYTQASIRSAGGAQFSGDFVVAARTMASATLEVVIVDVSGKGLAAGTRALQLSGALGGLLGALPPAAFLGAANDYLLRQDWQEGFATAAHLAMNLETGHFELRKAGHPPAVQWSAGSGRWRVHASRGPALGIVADADFELVLGRVEHGDVLMLYTDGVVETPQRDFTLGIDKMLGQAERLGTGGWEDCAERLLQQLDETGDDRAIFFLHRR